MPAAEVKQHSRRAILTVAITAIALETALLGVVAPLLPEIEERTGAGDAALGLALAAYALPILIISIPTGRLADRIGRRPLLLGGLVLTAAGSLLIAFSDSLGVLLTGRAVQGFGSTASWVAALALVSDLALPGRKGEAIGFALAANSGGAIAGPAIGGIIGGTISFAAPFLMVATIAAVMFVAGWIVLPRGAPAAAPDGVDAGGGVLSALFRREAIAPGLVAVAGAAFFGMIDFAVPLDLDRRLGTAAVGIGLLFAAAATFDAIASPLAGRAGDRRGRRPIVITGALVVAASGLGLAVFGTLAGAAIALIAFGIGMAIVFAGAVPWLDDTFGEFDRGLAYGGLNLVYATGYTVGPLIGGWLLEGPGADAVYLLMAGISMAGALLLFGTGRRGRAPG